MDASDFLEKLPLKAGKILDCIADNKLSVTVHAIDEKVLINGFQKIANRITVGLVLAALIMGASTLMSVPTSFTLFGYPGLAILCFCTAAGCGFGLVVEILVSDSKSRSYRTLCSGIKLTDETDSPPTRRIVSLRSMDGHQNWPPIQEPKPSPNMGEPKG